MGYDLQTRRCACNATFKLATLRSRETECYACQRKRASGMIAAAMAAGRLEGVTTDGEWLDYRPVPPKPTVPDRWWCTPHPKPPEPAIGQFYETRNEAEYACPVGWGLRAQICGGWRVFPSGYEPERKPIPAAAQPAPVDRRAEHDVIAARIERARQQLIAQRERRAALEAHARQVKASQAGSYGLARTHLSSLSELVEAGFMRPEMAGNVIQRGDTLYKVIADPSVPPGKVRMAWTDPDGFTRVETMGYEAEAYQARIVVDANHTSAARSWARVTLPSPVSTKFADVSDPRGLETPRRGAGK